MQNAPCPLCFMKIQHSTVSPVLLAGLAFSVSKLQAVEYFSESFDEEATAQVSFVKRNGTYYEYVDYSNFTVSSPNPAVGSAVKSIPAAPNTLPGTAATKGMLLQLRYENVTVNDPPPNTITVVPTDDRMINVVAMSDPLQGVRLVLPSNYRVSFDFYLRLDPAATLDPATGLPTGLGTTEQMTWCVGYTTTGDPLGRLFRTLRGAGIWGWLSTEGGHASTAGGDAALYNGPNLVAGRDLGKSSGVDLADVAPYFTPAFGASSSPMPSAPANQWVTAVITKIGTQITVEYKGTQAGTALTKFFDKEDAPLDGGNGLMVGYDDSFASKSYKELDQWMLLDNLFVEELPSSTMTVAPDPSAPINTFTGTLQTGAYTVQNLRQNGTLTITGASFGGTNAQDFSILTPLPLTIEPQASATLIVAFNPTAPNGVKRATMSLTSNDPSQPTYDGIRLAARRSVSPFFPAHFKLEETAGANNASLANSAGTQNGVFQVRQAPTFQNPGLNGDGGKSIGMLPSQTTTTGNYFLSAVPHTPSLTISMWIKPQTTVVVEPPSSPNRTLFQRDFDYDTTYDEIYGLVLEPNGQLVFRASAAEVLRSEEPVITDGQIYHIVLTHRDSDGFGNQTADRTRLYINGLLVRSASGADSKGFVDYPLVPLAGTEAFYIGSRTTVGDGYKGDLDDIQIYSDELSPEQVWNLYRQPGSTGLTVQTLSTTSTVYLPPGGPGGANGALELTFRSNPSISYRVSSSINLVDWNPIGDFFNGAANADSTTRTIALPPAPLEKRFYRIEAP